MTESQQKSQDKDTDVSSSGITGQSKTHSACRFKSSKPWLEPQYHENDNERIKKPNELEDEMQSPPNDIDREILDRIHGSMIGMALGDALGASVEFRPHAYMVENPVATLQGGGTWGLEAGQFTDDTSMALCLANSLVARGDYVPYDQLVRYKWWHREGYMSSTGNCFDIDEATKNSLVEFEHRQKKFAEENGIPIEQIDYLSAPNLLEKFKVNCSEHGVAGNGALMRLAPVPLFFFRDPILAVEYSGQSGKITHGDKKAYDACRYYGALIVAAVNGESRDELLDENFYENHVEWFDDKPLDPEIMNIAHGSYQKEGGYAGGIRGKGYIVSALEAALWAFWFHKNSFEKGALAAVNLGDDADTTAAIYGQLAGAYYGYKNLPKKWRQKVYAKRFIKCLSKWIVYEGEKWSQKRSNTSPKPTKISKPGPGKNKNNRSKSPTEDSDTQTDSSSGCQSSTSNKPKNKERRSSVDPNYFSKLNVDQQSATHGPKSAEYPDNISSNKNWDPSEEVYHWLGTLGKKYVDYAPLFKQRNVNRYRDLYNLTDENLENFEIKNQKHRQTILKEIEKLKKKSK